MPNTKYKRRNSNAPAYSDIYYSNKNTFISKSQVEEESYYNYE